MTPETQLKHAITNALGCMNVFNFPVLQGLGSYPGIADRIACHKVKVSKLVELGIDEIGVFVAIEVKAGKNQLSEKQAAFGQNVQDAGGIFVVARSIDDVIDALGERDRFLF